MEATSRPQLKSPWQTQTGNISPVGVVSVVHVPTFSRSCSLVTSSPSCATLQTRSLQASTYLSVGAHCATTC